MTRDIDPRMFVHARARPYPFASRPFKSPGKQARTAVVVVVLALRAPRPRSAGGTNATKGSASSSAALRGATPRSARSLPERYLPLRPRRGETVPPSLYELWRGRRGEV